MENEWEGFGEADLQPETYWVVLASSNVYEAKIDGADLLVKFYSFKSGALRQYRYLGAGPEGPGLFSAESPGRFVHQRLINKYTTVPC